MKHTKIRILIIFLTLVSTLFAQYGGRIPFAKNSYTLEYLKPFMKAEEWEEFGFMTSVLFLSGQFQISSRTQIFGCLPFANMDYSYNSVYYTFEKRESNFGNFYLGLEYATSPGVSSIEIGTVLPLANDEKFYANYAGYASDINRWELFTTNWLPIVVVGHLGQWSNEEKGTVLRSSVGISYLINTDKQEYEDNTETYLLYQFFLGHRTHYFFFHSAVSGRYWATAGAGDFGERSIHQLLLGIDLNTGHFRPGISFTIPLDSDYHDTVNFVLGIRLSYMNQ